MIKKAYLLLLLSLFSAVTASFADDWNVYPSYNNATYCEIVGKKIYVLTNGSLFSYNTEDNEIVTYDKINSLSDIEIIHIAYSKEISGLVIIYKNANIDILYEDESIYNISDFKNNTIDKKKINGINIFGKIAYLSTEFGVVEVDLEKKQINNSYNTGLNTFCTYLFNKYLYTGTTDGIHRCDTSDNMLDKNNWEKINYNNQVDAICELDGKLYVLTKKTGIHKLDADNGTSVNIVAKSGGEFHTIYSNDNEIIAPALDKLTLIEKDNKIHTYKTDNCMYVLKDGNDYWNCNGYDGILKCTVKDNRLTPVTQPITINSPVRNHCEFMKFTNDNRLLVAGGNLNYFDIIFHDGTVMEYNMDNDSWFNFPEDTIKKVTGFNYRNVCSVDEDPNEPGHIFACSFGNGLYEFRNGKFEKHYNHLNSILQSAITSDPHGNYVRLSHVEFDKESNLWCINTYSKDIVKILKKDGTWISLNYKEIEGFTTMVQPLFDSRGWLWITSLQGHAGIFCAKIKNTPFDTSDDETKLWVNKFTNQDGTSYDIYQVHAIREDKNKDIWIGTNTGLFVIDNPEEFFNNGIFKQIKIPRNDGTGLADYLMNGIYIKAIAVDEANRKWIGTLDSGIYLISSDGQETIHHFTTENSPLPSNAIESIAINNNTGDVFIGTDKGIASFKSDAVRAEEKLSDSKVHVYPNPVRPGYNGNVSIVGLTDNCNVKIVDGAGYLIDEGYSNGGMYQWNGRNIRGEKVASGVYYVLLYDETGKEGEVAKILIAR